MFKYMKQGGAFYKKTLLLMFPLIIQNIVSCTLALADTFMVGMLGETELAAMTLANNPFFVLQIMTFGIQSGACVLVAQYYGKHDNDTINRVLGVGICAGLLFTGVATALILAFPEGLMGLLTNNDSLVPIAAKYAEYVGPAYVLASISGVYIAIQRSVENVRFGAAVLVSSALMNVVLNYMLIFGKFGAPEMGVVGAAVATMISRAFEVLVTIVHSALSKRLPIKLKYVLKPGRAITHDFIKYSLPVVINETFWSIGTSIYTIVMGYMAGSQAILAALSIINNIDRIVAAMTFAIGNATAVIIGKEIGAGHSDTVYGKAVALNVMSVLIGIFNAGMLLLVRFFVAEQFLYPLLELSTDAYNIANMMLIVLAVAAPFRVICHVNIVGTFRGGGDVRTAMIMDILPIYLFALPVMSIAALGFGAGISVVFPLRMSEEAVKSIWAIKRLASRKWIKNVTRGEIAEGSGDELPLEA